MTGVLLAPPPPSRHKSRFYHCIYHKPGEIFERRGCLRRGPCSPAATNEERYRRMCRLQLMSQNISERGAWNYLSLNITVTLNVIILNVVVRHSTSGDSRSKSHCTDLLQVHTEWSKLRLSHYPVTKTFFAATSLL